MLLRQGVKAALLITQKWTQRGCQIEETKKHGPEKEQNKTPEKEQNSRKELNEMEITNLFSDVEFKTLVIRMLKELTEYGNNIKKSKAEMNVTLSKMKKSL